MSNRKNKGQSLLRLPHQWRITSELVINSDMFQWVLLIVHMQYLSKLVPSPTLHELYFNRMRTAFAWFFEDWHDGGLDLPLIQSRKELSQWEAFLALTGTVIATSMSIKDVVVNIITNTVEQEPTSYSYSHKLTGSVVATSIIAQRFIEEITIGGSVEYAKGVRPLIEQIHTVKRVIEDVSSFPTIDRTDLYESDDLRESIIAHSQRISPIPIRSMDDFKKTVDKYAESLLKTAAR